MPGNNNVFKCNGILGLVEIMLHIMIIHKFIYFINFDMLIFLSTFLFLNYFDAMIITHQPITLRTLNIEHSIGHFNIFTFQFSFLLPN